MKKHTKCKKCRKKHNALKSLQAARTEKRPYTLFLDIDGCLVQHSGILSEQMGDLVLLPGVKDKLNEWDKQGYKLILTTGRKESMRKLTEKQLTKLGLFWDQLVMGIGGGQRIIINDLKPNSNIPTAIAVNIKRNDGLADIDLEYYLKLQTVGIYF